MPKTNFPRRIIKFILILSHLAIFSGPGAIFLLVTKTHKRVNNECGFGRWTDTIVLGLRLDKKNKWLSREVSQHEHDQELPDERKGVRGE